VAKGREKGARGETKRKVEKGGSEGKREKVADRAELARGGNKSHLFFLLVFLLLFFPPPRVREETERDRKRKRKERGAFER